MHSIPLIICLPFGVILLLIAIMPLALPAFWENNKNKAIIVFFVSIPVCIYLFLNYPNELIGIMEDYGSFIILLASLYIISGGILVTSDLRATPKTNLLLLLFGGVIANLVGTTGASMLLIRPFLRTNSHRKFIKHLPVFFIFIVSNIGGTLTPLGDPPLFLGFLKGVPFTWTLGLFPIWVTTMAIVLLVFYIMDNIYYKKERKEDIQISSTQYEPIRFSGLINLLFLLGVVLAVFFQIKAPYREFIMIIMAIFSILFTKKGYRESHKFTYNPIIEVAVLFVGIFITMGPLVMLLQAKGAELGVTKPWQFFWTTGILSSFLDNAPTYFTFFSLAESVTKGIGYNSLQSVAGVSVDLLAAISCGAVFMGANTYIGNGPNFMVKTITEEQGIKIPHFFGYMAYSGMILIPTFILITFLFFI